MAEVLDIVVRQRGARRVSKDIAAIGVSAMSASTRLKMLQQALKGAATGMTQASVASGKFTVACQKTSRCTNQAAAGLKRTRLGLSGVGTGAFVAGAALSAGFIRPLVAAIGAAGEFEQAMNLVGVLTNVDRASDAFASLERTALQLGITTKFTAVEAAKGMEFLALAGFEADQVLETIPTTLNLAAAASIDLARASDIATNILKGFRLEVEDLPQAVDVLAATFSSSNVNIEQLAQSFVAAGPIAAQFGQRFEDVAAVIGSLGDAGIQAEKAGVALRRLFINLQTDAAKSTSILRKFGISIEDDVTGQMRPLIDIFKDIADAPLSSAESIKLFGARALASAGIIKDSAPILEAFAKGLRESVGRAAEIAEARMRGFDGAMTRLSSAVTGFGIAIAQSGLLEFFTKLIEGLTVAARFLANLPKPILVVIGAFLTLGSILGAVLVPIGLLAVGLSTLAPLFAPGVIAGYAATLGTFLLAIAPVVIAVTAAVVAFSLLKDIQFEVGGTTVTIGVLFAELGESIKTTAKEAVLSFKLLKDDFNDLSKDMADDSKGITDNLPSFNEFVASGIASFEIFGRVVAAVFVRIGKGIGGFASDATDAVFAIPEAIKAAFDGDESTTAGSVLASKFRNGFIEQFEGFGDEVKAIVEDATAKANSALALLGQTDFIKRAAARVSPVSEEVEGGRKKKGGLGGTEGGKAIPGFNEQQVAAAEAVNNLTAAITPGNDAILKMVDAINILNTAQQLQVITGEKNVEILKSLTAEGGEKFLASIDPVTAAYRDQRIELAKLAVAKELFNLNDKEAFAAAEEIKRQTDERILQLELVRNEFSLVEAAQKGVSEGFKEFAKSLGTTFSTIKDGMVQLVTLIADTLVEALVSGQLAFKDLGLAAVKIIQQIITQLLVQIAVEAILKALRLGASGGADVTVAANGASITSRATGGPVNGSVGQTFLVGEEGPELFVPKSSGDIIPNRQTAAMMNVQAAPPVVNVQIVNVSDESGVPDAMATQEGERVIINTIQKNRNQLKEFI